MKVSDSEMVAEIERQIAEGTDLDGLIPVRSEPPPAKSRRAVFSIRLGTDELGAIANAAKKQGLSIGDFIRESAKQAAKHEELLDAEAADYSLEAFQVEYEELGRKLERSLARKRGSTAARRT